MAIVQASFYPVLAGLVAGYLALVEVAKKPFYQHSGPSTEQRVRRGRTTGSSAGRQDSAAAPATLGRFADPADEPQVTIREA
jgi:hypothetical protein